MAAAGVDLRMIGDKALLRRFNALEGKEQKKFTRKALRKAGKPILASAKANAPTDEGRLRKTLKLRALKRSRRSFGVRIMTGTREQLGIPPGAKGFYPLSIETGFIHARSGRHVPARPYLRAALKDNREKALGIMRESIWADLKAFGRSR